MRGTVLHLCSSLGIYGAESVILMLATEQHRGEWEPVIGVIRNEYCPHVELADEANNRGLQSEVLSCARRFDLGLVRRLRRLLVDRQVAVLHTHGYKANFHGLLAAIHTPTRLVATCHNWTLADARLRFYAWLDQQLLRRLGRVVAVSTQVRETLLALGLPGEHVETIPNGVAVERFDGPAGVDELRENLGLSAHERVIAVVGRLSPEKGHRFLLEAAKQLVDEFPECRFLLVGDGPEEAELRRKCRLLGLESRVIFAGVRRVEPVYRLAECVVIPSLTEGLPMVLLEAMAARVPVVATRVGEIPTVLDGGAAGVLVEPADIDGLRSGIRQLLDSRETGRQLAERAYDRVRRCYSARAMAERYARIYAQLSN